MESARPLHEVFADLTGTGGAAGDVRDLLTGQGHPGLPDELVAEAVVSYADTAPAEVAEHLAPFVTAHSAVGADEVPEAEADWADLMMTAPSGDAPDELDDVDADAGTLHDAGDLDVDFGAGAEPSPTVDTGADDEEPDESIDDDVFANTDDPIALDNDMTGDAGPETADDLGDGDDGDDLDDDEPDADPLA